jgi:hypothetical protein
MTTQVRTADEHRRNSHELWERGPISSVRTTAAFRGMKIGALEALSGPVRTVG